MGRPSDYTEEVASEICGRLAAGESLVRICRDDHIPCTVTVYRWLAANDAFRNRYASAREDQADTFADEIQQIADEPMLGKKVTTKANGDVETVEGDMIEHRRLRVEARKWIAAKLKPKKYGDKVKLEGAGPNGEHLMQAVVNVSIGN